MKVSIIIPVYNSVNTLRDCLDSILKQTFQNWEAICVNDGSQDGSLAILEEYENKDKRIKILSKANGGAASARNFALDYITDEKNRWISFVDADDYISPQMYELIDNALTKEDNDEIDYVRIFPTRTSKRYQENLSESIENPDYQVVDRGGVFSCWHSRRINCIPIY